MAAAAAASSNNNNNHHLLEKRSLQYTRHFHSSPNKQQRKAFNRRSLRQMQEVSSLRADESPLNFFGYRDASDITWAHAVSIYISNKQQSVRAAIIRASVCV